MFRKLAPLAAVVVAALLLSGCFEIEEKVSLAPTGESNIRFLIRLPIPAKADQKVDAGAQETVDKLSSELAGFTSVKVNTEETLGQTIIAIDASAPSFSKLSSFYGPLMKDEQEKAQGEQPKLGGVLQPGSFYSIKRKGDRLIITRTFLPSGKKKKKQKDEDKNLEALMGFMGGVFMRFELTVPGTIVSSNAQETDGSRLTWVVPLNYFETNKVVLKAEVQATPEVAVAIAGK